MRQKVAEGSCSSEPTEKKNHIVCSGREDENTCNKENI